MHNSFFLRGGKVVVYFFFPFFRFLTFSRVLREVWYNTIIYFIIIGSFTEIIHEIKFVSILKSFQVAKIFRICWKWKRWEYWTTLRSGRLDQASVGGSRCWKFKAGGMGSPAKTRTRASTVNLPKNDTIYCFQNDKLKDPMSPRFQNETHAMLHQCGAGMFIWKNVINSQGCMLVCFLCSSEVCMNVWYSWMPLLHACQSVWLHPWFFVACLSVCLTASLILCCMPVCLFDCPIDSCCMPVCLFDCPVDSCCMPVSLFDCPIDSLLHACLSVWLCNWCLLHPCPFCLSNCMLVQLFIGISLKYQHTDAYLHL